MLRNWLPSTRRGAEVAADWDDLQSPESYLGFGRTRTSRPLVASTETSRAYAAPAQLKLNQWALAGNWTFENDAVMLNEVNGRIAYQFHARDLHLVMGPATRGTSMDSGCSSMDNRRPRPMESMSTIRVTGTVAEQRLHQLIRQPVPVSERRFEIEFLDSGVAAYAFTFG